MELKACLEMYSHTSRKSINFTTSRLSLAKILERIKIDGWKANLLSSASEILIKSAAQAIPAYSMSILKLAKGDSVEGWVKVNCDGASNKHSLEGAEGIIFRDYHGRPVGKNAFHLCGEEALRME
ncbi:hypothetical protein FEM48_Zijuj06G0166700 [Ziziphus jujuba var. spinosa]|uniref:RNase H type-1 domain-containing protein n=1 Tax=Ziziphus jujuba var. spinosa TaxID=714518 RepID=A0A978VAF1_ZIZJJ|nr:hypothetical protein FEM48_Zijuj06G0166700 [Ziziphus jujuba var. spinosa]